VGGLTYTWSNASGVVGTGSSYSATVSGVYTVIGSDPVTGCTSPASSGITVTVNPTPPKPDITAGGPLTFCSGSSLLLTSSSVGAGTYQWFNGGTAIPGETNPTYNAITSGTYTVVITSGLNCASPASDAKSVTVNPTPLPPSVNSVGPTNFCSGGSVTINASSPVTGTYQWFNNGVAISGETNSSIVATIAGDYTVVITSDAPASCPSAASSPITVIINPTPPKPDITAGGPLTFCSGGSLLLTSSSTGAGTYQWFNGGAALAGETNPTYTATTSGTYTVVITSASSCASPASDAKTVTVNPTPNPPSVTSVGPTTFCSGGSVTLNASSPVTGTYQWFNNGSAISGETNSSLVVTIAGDYTVVITTDAPASCPSSASSPITVIVNPTPQDPSITPNGPTTFCAGASVLLTSSSNGAGTYQWYDGGTLISGQTNPTFSATSAGTYTVVITSTSNCPSAASAAVTVIVNPNPVPPVVTAGDTTVFCTGGSVDLNITSDLTGVTLIEWSDGTTVVGNGPTYTTSTTGTYTVTIRASTGCQATSSSSAVSVLNLPVLTASPSGSGACAGAPVGLTSNATGGSGSYFYKWTAIQDPNFLRTAPNPGFSAPGATTDYIIVVQDASTNSLSCSVSDTVTLLVSSPFLNAGGTLNICAGSPNTLVPATILNSVAPTFEWTMITGTTSYVDTLADVLTPAITVPATIAVSNTSTYLLTVQDNGCTVVDMFTLVINPMPSVSLSTDDTVVCSGANAVLNALITTPSTSPYVYHWLQTKNNGVGPGNDTLAREAGSFIQKQFSTAAYPDSNFYHLTVVDSKGCVALSDTVQVKAYDVQALVIPNLITPNNDDRNECFIIKDINNFDILPGSSLEIYNSWGQAVFKAKNYSNLRPWCGSSLTDGVYYYYIKTGCGEQDLKGWLHIISNEAKF
jgi:hypothetical protein